MQSLIHINGGYTMIKFNSRKLSNEDAYSKVTKKITDSLEKGVIPWKQPWSNAGLLPMNISSQKTYKGSNILLGFVNCSTPFWGTFKQIKDLGGYVKKGEESNIITYAETRYKHKKTGKYLPKGKYPKSKVSEKYEIIPIIKYYNVFNLDQTDGIPEDKIPEIVKKHFDPIEKAEQFLKSANIPEIKESKNLDLSCGRVRAFYLRNKDYIQVPTKDLYNLPEDYYSTVFHEMIHATGAPCRLKREIDGKFGDEKYSKEELIAEIGSAYLCGICGIGQATIENTTGYIQGWLKKLNDDNKLIIQAASKAQEAVEYILDGF
jgi:antirestriction protein ArdC